MYDHFWESLNGKLSFACILIFYFLPLLLFSLATACAPSCFSSWLCQVLVWNGQETQSAMPWSIVEGNKLSCCLRVSRYFEASLKKDKTVELFFFLVGERGRRFNEGEETISTRFMQKTSKECRAAQYYSQSKRIILKLWRHVKRRHHIPDRIFLYTKHDIHDRTTND
jgi:hypothetical protein